MRGPGAMVANHSSWLDIFVLNAAAPLFFVSKAEVAGWPGINILTRVTDTHFVVRDPRLAQDQARSLQSFGLSRELRVAIYDGDTPRTAAEAATEPGLVTLAHDLDLPLVATNPCCFSDSGFLDAHDAMLCIAHSSYIESEDRPRSCAHAWMKPAEARVVGRSPWQPAFFHRGRFRSWMP